MAQTSYNFQAAPWVKGGVASLVAILALYIAAHAGAAQPLEYYGGLIGFAVMMGYIIHLIRKGCDALWGH